MELLLRSSVVYGGRVKSEPIIMHRFSRRNWQGCWAGMALLALLIVFTSPALAFACCCHQSGATVSSPAHSSTLSALKISTASAPAHPGCPGHDSSAQENQNQRQSPAQSNPVSISSNTPPFESPSFQKVCACAHNEVAPAAFIEKHNHSAFSSLVLGGAVKAYSLNSGLPPSVRLAFASSAARPRSPSLAHQSGRAPPAFGLLS